MGEFRESPFYAEDRLQNPIGATPPPRQGVASGDVAAIAESFGRQVALPTIPLIARAQFRLRPL